MVEKNNNIHFYLTLMLLYKQLMSSIILGEKDGLI